MGLLVKQLEVRPVTTTEDRAVSIAGLDAISVLELNEVRRPEP